MAKRNPIAKALFSLPHLKPKVLPVKKGKGVVYNRKKARKVDPSEPFAFVESLILTSVNDDHFHYTVHV